MATAAAMDSEMLFCSLLFLGLVALLLVRILGAQESRGGTGVPPVPVGEKRCDASPSRYRSPLDRYLPAGSTDRVPSHISAIKPRCRHPAIGELHASLAADYGQQFEQAIKMIRL